MTRTITTCPGIGDTIWLLMKLINQKEKFHWKVGDGSPQRSKPLFDLFPQLTESFEYIPNSGYKQIKRDASRGLWKQMPDKFSLEANSHLEAGFRIEDFLPDLETSFILPYQTDNYFRQADNFIKKPTYISQGKYIGIYTTSYSNSRYMSGWLLDEWSRFIQLLRVHNPEYKFVFIGAEYDLGLSDELMKLFPKEIYINAMNQSLGVTIEILKRLEMFVGFQSGLSIINETIGAKQTVMLYSPKLAAMIETWPDKKRIESGAYKGATFGTAKHPLKPEQLFDWLIEFKKI